MRRLCVRTTRMGRPVPPAFLALPFVLGAALSVRAATVIPPRNLGDLGRRADAVVLATALESRPAQRGPLLFTSTRFLVHEAVSGGFRAGDEFSAEAPGGERDGIGWAVAGSPRFEPGTAYLLFLTAAPGRVWQPTVLSWGILRRVETETLGNVLVPLEEGEQLEALPRPDGMPSEALVPMLETPLLQHLESVISRREEWNAALIAAPQDLLTRDGTLSALSVPSQCTFMSGSSGNLRWRTFDTGGAVAISGALPGDSSLPGGGFSQVSGAVSAWMAVPSTNLSLSYGGQVTYSLTCTSGQDQPDRYHNVVVFNDPCSDIPDLSGCTGTLAFGGPWFNLSTFTFDGAPWQEIIAWGVVVNNGAGCLGSTNYQLMLTHELGHGLGFGHVSDSSALMYYLCCHVINSTDTTCAQYSYPAAGPPVASFTFSPSSPVAGQSVSFTDTSAPAATSWSWSFGDGGTSTLKSPTHAFAAAGTYSVVLTATNAGGSDDVTRSVTVSPLVAPVASFTFSPSSPVAGQTVYFSDTSTSSPTSWSWTFGDGGTSTLKNPTHVYAASGTYTVSLTATNAAGSGSTSRSFTVTQPAAPVADFSFSPPAPVAGQSIAFYDLSSGGPTSWSWSFGDGTYSTSPNPVKAYAASGTYTVTLLVSNGSGSSSASKQVTVSSAGGAPVASFTFAPASPLPGQTVQFTDTSTGGPTGWTWDFGDGTFSAAQNPTKVYGGAGTLTVRLTAYNAYGSSVATKPITIGTGNRPPTAVPDSYSIAAGNALAAVPPGVLANDSDPDGDPLVAVLVTPPASGSLGLQPSGAFVYSPAPGFLGTVSFVYRAEDGKGGVSANATATITVTPSETERVVPILLDAYGVGSSRFRSELVLVNRGNTTAAVDLTYTAASALGASGSGTVTENLWAGRQLVLDDALAYLRSRGLLIPQAAPGASQGGTLRVRFRGLSSPDAGAAFARTTALLPDGRAGVAYPGLVPSAWDTPLGQNVFGLRENAQSRSNLALVNLGSSGDVGLRVTLFSGSPGDRRTYVLPETYWLAPLQWIQLSAVLGRAGYTNGYALVERVSGSSPYYAYGVFNDNGTNDGSFIDPIPVAAGVPSRIVPVVLELGIYGSELILTNPSSSTVAVDLRYFESASADGVARSAGSDALQPREQKIVEAIPYLRSLGVDVGPAGGSYAGAVVATFSAAGRPENGFAGGRAKSPGPNGGSYGVYYSGLGSTQTAASEAWVYGLKQDGESRTNVAIAHAEPGGAPIVLQAQVFDGATGASVGGTGSVTLKAGQWFQWNQLLSGFGLSQGYVRVFRVSGSSPFLAYGVVNDGGTSRPGTNDGSYVPMIPGK